MIVQWSFLPLISLQVSQPLMFLSSEKKISGIRVTDEIVNWTNTAFICDEFCYMVVYANQWNEMSASFHPVQRTASHLSLISFLGPRVSIKWQHSFAYKKTPHSVWTQAAADGNNTFTLGNRFVEEGWRKRERKKKAKGEKQRERSKRER